MGSDRSAAFRASCLKHSISKQEKTSAVALLVPAICVMSTCILKWVAQKYNIHTYVPRPWSRAASGPLEPYITHCLIITMEEHFLAFPEVALCVDCCSSGIKFLSCNIFVDMLCWPLWLYPPSRPTGTAIQDRSICVEIHCWWGSPVGLKDAVWTIPLWQKLQPPINATNKYLSEPLCDIVMEAWYWAAGIVSLHKRFCQLGLLYI